jgi:hypothetical protein
VEASEMGMLWVMLQRRGGCVAVTDSG